MPNSPRLRKRISSSAGRAAILQPGCKRCPSAAPSVIGEKTDGSNEFDAMLEDYSAISRKVAEDTGAQLLDLREQFMAWLAAHNPDNLAKGILTRDTVHLNPAGNRFVADRMLEALGVEPRKR